MAFLTKRNISIMILVVLSLGIAAAVWWFTQKRENMSQRWGCVQNGQQVGTVNVDWGTGEKGATLAGDATWACNNWVSQCGNGGGCTANKSGKSRKNTAQFGCKDASGHYVGQADVNWGAGPNGTASSEDGAWACNNWFPSCNGQCSATYKKKKSKK